MQLLSVTVLHLKAGAGNISQSLKVFQQQRAGKAISTLLSLASLLRQAYAGKKRAKSTACFILAHPQPSQQALVATGSQEHRQQPGCYKLQLGTSPVTCFIAQDQGSTATGATLFSELPCRLLGHGESSVQELNASSARQLMTYSESQTAKAFLKPQPYEG